MATELRVVIDPQVEAKRADVDSSNSWDDSPHHLLTQTDRFGVQSPATARTPPPTSPARGAGPQHPRSPRGAGASKSGFGPSASSASPPAAAPTLAERFFCCFCAPEASPATGAAAAPTPPGSGSDAVASEGLLGPMSEADEGKICLVLDLDETLVHSSFRPIPNPDFVLPVEIDGTVHHVYVLKRPGVDTFLVQCAEIFEIVLYTASLSKYADPLLDLLDPDGLISHRLFREHCVFHRGTFVKDLSLLGRYLPRCLIIDNSPASYMFHPQNAVGCTSFIDRRDDDEFDVIFPFLEKLSKVENVEEHTQPWVAILDHLEEEAERRHNSS